jgi:hypothetical protein
MRASLYLLRASVLFAAIALAVPAHAQDAPAADDDQQHQAEGFVLPQGTEAISPFVIMGYIDVGFAKVSGNGSSFAPGDPTPEPDYHADAFAPAVNSRGEVASIDAGKRELAGFVPRSLNIADRPSFLLNTFDLDLRYQAPRAPVMAFARLQVLPRWGGDGHGNVTTVYLEQAFGRVTPFDGRELFLALGKFDSVLGIEYLENQANYRTGVTPSLFARYTTGTALGAKVFGRVQLPALWSALSLNVAATNSPNFIEALQPPDASLTGVPVLSGRAGYELNLPQVQLKLGASGLHGPRNDQHEADTMMTVFVLDARLVLGGLSLSGEYLEVEEEGGEGEKQTGLGGLDEPSEFHAQGGWLQAAYTFRLDSSWLRAITLYTRIERRHAWFEDMAPITVGRLTAGLRFDLWDCLLIKGETLLNRELEGAPGVENDVLTFSVVYSW